MKSYAKDISDGTAKPIFSRAVDPIALPFYDEDEGPSSSRKVSSSTATSSSGVPTENPSLWCEAKTDEGYTYYWNVKTNGNYY